MKTIFFQTFSLLSVILSLSFRAGAAVEPEANGAKTISSKITEVTVYADRAQVTRTASVTPTPAPLRLAFPKLPGWLDGGSVRVSLTPSDALLPSETRL